MKCPNCGNVPAKGDVHCRNCNAQLSKKTYICSCGKEVSIEVGVCYDCYKKFEETEKKPRCGNCNNLILESELFCANCGKQIIP
ncbi:hypothetical protein HY643_04780 [Candidatus Woesearchaeota archaeon]|nr:hypothetical protein [Candidatus Woesearchaeota archaeon]